MKVMKKLSTFNVIHYINPVILLKMTFVTQFFAFEKNHLTLKVHANRSGFI